MKVLVYSVRPYDREILSELIGSLHELIFTEKKLNLATAEFAGGCEAVSLFTSDDASGPVLEKLYSLGVKYVSLRCVGHDHVDLQKAGALGLHVANVPEYSPYSVAEQGVAMLMAMNRKIMEGQRLIQLNDYRLDTLMGFDIHGKTVGVIGTGNIGMAFLKIMKGFGAKILAADPVQNPHAIELGAKYVSLNELLGESDIVSIHCPLNNATKHLFSEKQFLMMKKDAVLINTSRGGIINTKDLIKVLGLGRFKAVCLDVYENEKGIFFEDHRNSPVSDVDFLKLRSFKNVMITGHQGFLTEEALMGIAKTTLLNLNHWQNGNSSPHELQKAFDNAVKVQTAIPIG